MDEDPDGRSKIGSESATLNSFLHEIVNTYLRKNENCDKKCILLKDVCFRVHNIGHYTVTSVNFQYTELELNFLPSILYSTVYNKMYYIINNSNTVLVLYSIQTINCYKTR